MGTFFLRRTQVIREDIMQWIYILHKSVPRCTVMLVASHCDELEKPDEAGELLRWVEERVHVFHEEWKGRRRSELELIDKRLVLMPVILQVSCGLSQDGASTGLEEVMSKLLSKAKGIHIPPTWRQAMVILDDLAGRGKKSSAAGSDGGSRNPPCSRPWIYREEAFSAFDDYYSNLDAGDPLRGFLHDASTRHEAVIRAVNIM